MKENVDKNIEELTKKMMKDVALESPSFDFTSQVMSQLDAISSNEVTKYKPLISRRFWIVILLAVVGLVGFSIFGGTAETTSWLNKVNLDVISSNRIVDGLSSIVIPKTVVYTIVLLGFVMLVQIPLLKHYFNKRLEM